MSVTPIRFDSAQFATSAAKLSQCPADDFAEVAFAGRSNAGKSSALNTLCRQGKLARTSKTPGRTQLINFFDVGDYRLVDLPGYGFAKVPEAVKNAWQKNITAYLRNRESLNGLVLVMDIRHPLKTFDANMVTWCHDSSLPVHALLTKADKLSKSQASQTRQKVNNELGKLTTGYSCQLFSAPKKQGTEELAERISSWLSPEGAKI